MRIKLSAILCLFFIIGCTSQQLQQGAGILLDTAVGGGEGGGGVSQLQVANGLKEALKKGAGSAGSNLSKLDGFLKNQAVKILFPPEFRQVESTLKSLGLGSLTDQAVTSFNRAAEKASSKAYPILANAVTKMTFQDAMNILLGGQKDAATQYLKKTPTQQLTAAFLPVVRQSANQVDATKYWGNVATAYNKVPFVKKVPSDITSYITDKTLNGLFHMVEEEEKNIRANPLARTSSLLKTVFGYADQKGK